MIIKKFSLAVNIIFFIYYAIQLLVFTDEFATKNIGFFNHAVAGLSEIIGIIFFSLAIGLIIIIFRGSKNQLPLLITVLLIQTIISLNFWRYVFIVVGIFMNDMKINFVICILKKRVNCNLSLNVVIRIITKEDINIFHYSPNH